MAVLDLKLFLSGSANRTYTCASTTVNALIGVDNILTVSLRDCFNRADLLAETAADALVCYLVADKGSACTCRTLLIPDMRIVLVSEVADR